MKYLLFILSTLINIVGYCQSRTLIDTFAISTSDTFLNEITFLLIDCGGGAWYHQMKPTAPDGYYKVYHAQDGGNYFYREGCFKNGREKGNWLEYHQNGGIACVSRWNKNGNSGISKIYNTKGELIRKLKWLGNFLIVNKKYEVERNKKSKAR